MSMELRTPQWPVRDSFQFHILSNVIPMHTSLMTCWSPLVCAGALVLLGHSRDLQLTSIPKCDKAHSLVNVRYYPDWVCLNSAFNSFLLNLVSRVYRPQAPGAHPSCPTEYHLYIRQVIGCRAPLHMIG